MKKLLAIAFAGICIWLAWIAIGSEPPQANHASVAPSLRPAINSKPAIAASPPPASPAKSPADVGASLVHAVDRARADAAAAKKDLDAQRARCLTALEKSSTQYASLKSDVAQEEIDVNKARFDPDRAALARSSSKWMNDKSARNKLEVDALQADKGVQDALAHLSYANQLVFRSQDKLEAHRRDERQELAEARRAHEAQEEAEAKVRNAIADLQARGIVTGVDRDGIRVDPSVWLQFSRDEKAGLVDLMDQCIAGVGHRVPLKILSGNNDTTLAEVTMWGRTEIYR